MVGSSRALRSGTERHECHTHRPSHLPAHPDKEGDGQLQKAASASHANCCATTCLSDGSCIYHDKIVKVQLLLDRASTELFVLGEKGGSSERVTLVVLVARNGLLGVYRKAPGSWYNSDSN